jgi:hypothetical protein
MSQRLTNAFINTNVPGSYFDVKVRSTPVGVASSGNIVIIGEADGGAKFSSEVLKDNFFTPDQVDRVIAKYISGPIVDAFRALASPSSDADITGSANRIYIAQTAANVKAQATVASSYGTLKDKNFGSNGNKYFFQVTQLADEVGPSRTSGVMPALGAALTGVKFSVRVNGGAVTLIDVLTGPDTGYDTIAEVAALIDAALPAGLACTVATGNAITISADADSAANSKGWGKSFELIEGDPGDLSALGLTEGLVVSSQEPQIQLDIKRTDTNTNESFIVDAQVAMLIGYEGTTATLTINSTALTTSVTGGAGAALNVLLKDFATVADLAAFINSQTGYTCSVVSGSGQSLPSSLDKVTAQPICSSDAGLTPGRIKRSASNWASKVAQSAVLDFTATATAGLPEEMASVAYLSGGAKGATLAADIIAAITACETVNANFVIPLFSRNATDDIAEGLTSSNSTYTISAVNAAVKSHVLKMSTAKIKKHRTCFLSFWDNSFSGARAEAASLANARCSLAFQKTSQVNSQGAIVEFLPWHTAAIAAGMQAAGFYKAILNKFANVISFKDPAGFDSGSPGDLETALDSGLLFLERGVVGSKWVSDQTTYGVDTNFVYNSIQAMYAADLVSLDLSASFFTAFGGKSLADVDASTGLSFLASKMDQYKKQKLIAASSDAPLGFKNAKVSINGPVMDVAVEIKLATAIYFIPISIEISQVQSAA